MSNIRRKTYRNFMIVLKQIEAKGYSGKEAEDLVHTIFNNHEIYQSLGLHSDIDEWVGRVITKEQFEAEQNMWRKAGR